MARFTATCPECRKKSPYNPLEGLPHCAHCGYTPEDKSDVVIAMPFIGKATTKTADRTYRELERSSEIRAQLAADVAGVPVAEMSHLKVTNLKDNTREGEVAAMPVVNDITKQMDYMRSRGGVVGFGGANNASFGDAATQGAVTVNGQVTRGIEPRAGIRAMEQIQSRFLR